MAYMLGLIKGRDQLKSVEKPFNKRPGAPIVWCGKEKMTAWVCQFVEQVENVRHLLLIEMLDNLNAVDLIKWFIALQVIKLTQAKLEIRRFESLPCVVYRRWIAVDTSHITGTAGQKIANCPRTASRVQHALMLRRHCDPFY